MRKLLLWLIAVGFAALTLLLIWALVLPMYIQNGPDIPYSEFVDHMNNGDVLVAMYDREQGAILGLWRDTEISAGKLPARYDFRVVASEEAYLHDIVDVLPKLPRYSVVFGEKAMRGNLWQEYAASFAIAGIIVAATLSIWLYNRKRRSANK